jgi:hypothetical protein
MVFNCIFANMHNLTAETRRLTLKYIFFYVGVRQRLHIHHQPKPIPNANVFYTTIKI